MFAESHSAGCLASRSGSRAMQQCSLGDRTAAGDLGSAGGGMAGSRTLRSAFAGRLGSTGGSWGRCWARRNEESNVAAVGSRATQEAGRQASRLSTWSFRWRCPLEEGPEAAARDQTRRPPACPRKGVALWEAADRRSPCRVEGAAVTGTGGDDDGPAVAGGRLSGAASREAAWRGRSLLARLLWPRTRAKRCFGCERGAAGVSR